MASFVDAPWRRHKASFQCAAELSMSCWYFTTRHLVRISIWKDLQAKFDQKTMNQCRRSLTCAFAMSSVRHQPLGSCRVFSLGRLLGRFMMICVQIPRLFFENLPRSLKIAAKAWTHSHCGSTVLADSCSQLGIPSRTNSSWSRAWNQDSFALGPLSPSNKSHKGSVAISLCWGPLQLAGSRASGRQTFVTACWNDRRTNYNPPSWGRQPTTTSGASLRGASIAFVLNWSCHSDGRIDRRAKDGGNKLSGKFEKA